MYVIYTSNSFFLVNISDIVVTIVHEMHRFTEAQEAAIILQFGELKHATLVRRWFLKEYPDIPHHQVPVALQFSRIRDRFLKTNSTRPGKPPGPKVSVATPEMVETVRGMILADQSISISEIALRLDCSYGTAWNILRKKLKVVFIENEIKMTNWMFQVYPFRSTNVQKLDDTQKAGRRDFCQWILDKDKDFPDFVIR